jgi:hypothetical protein
MKVLILLSTLLLMSLSQQQMKEEFEECIKQGRDVKACRMQVRQLVRQEKEKIVMEDKVKKSQQNRREMLQKIDEAMNADKYILYDPTTGMQVDTRNLSYLDRTRVQCVSNGGTWSDGECTGQLAGVQYKEMQKGTGYMDTIVNQATQDQQTWNQVDQQLRYKEYVRKQKKELRKWKRKVAKHYQISVKDVDYYLQTNPQMVYQTIAQLQQQEMLKEQRDKAMLEQAKGIDPDKGQEASAKPAQQQMMPQMNGQGQPYYPQQQQGGAFQQYYQ